MKISDDQYTPSVSARFYNKAIPLVFFFQLRFLFIIKEGYVGGAEPYIISEVGIYENILKIES